MKESEKEYKKFQTKFQLPRLEVLKESFDFDNDFKENASLEEIRCGISDTLFNISDKIVEPLISGNNFCCMFEQKMLKSKDMKHLFQIYKKIQVIKWENNRLSIKYHEHRAAKCVKKMWKLWNEIKDEVEEFCKILSVGWEEMEPENKKLEYMG